ncbi:hypothetical protein ONS95_001594 [Cadophora gregata]|uniref:uncharacterized protein n=1 Tax=Cadophora gregata TaxID=51156 RepID=UPI0026DDAB1F|nr:uncharacterized protein ONS95_001594 [Cadophora gregata]KAK0111220.1 hypothetical protein ONS95_001594 [Cadophora gregata]
MAWVTAVLGGPVTYLGSVCVILVVAVDLRVMAGGVMYDEVWMTQLINPFLTRKCSCGRQNLRIIDLDIRGKGGRGDPTMFMSLAIIYHAGHRSYNISPN